MSETPHRDDLGARFGMWLFLFTELLLFGGLFILYAVYLARHPEAFARAGKELSLPFGTVNTVVLLTSSLLVALSVSALQRGSRRLCLWLLAGTILSAAVFMVNKYFEWSAKIHHGIYPGSPEMAGRETGEGVFFSLYYVTTGLHGVHVVVGALLLGWVFVLVKNGRVDSGNHVLLENAALYWHLVDLIWIFIFPLYYLIL